MLYGKNYSRSCRVIHKRCEVIGNIHSRKLVVIPRKGINEFGNRTCKLRVDTLYMVGVAIMEKLLHHLTVMQKHSNLSK